MLAVFRPELKHVPSPAVPAPAKAAKVTMDWLGGSSSSPQPAKPQVVDCSRLPLVDNEAGAKVLRFYWLDSYEDTFKNPGRSPTTLHIFIHITHIPQLSKTWPILNFNFKFVFDLGFETTLPV